VNIDWDKRFFLGSPLNGRAQKKRESLNSVAAQAVLL
jgi:hypothetical protein